MFDSLKKLLGAGSPPPRAAATRPSGLQAPGASRPSASAPLTGPAAREAPRPQDLVLASHAVRWLDAVPPRFRPAALAERFPRLCNRFALLWVDPVLCDSFFDSLMVDRRGGRKGFPPEITAEILRLHDYYLSLQQPGYRPLMIDAGTSATAGRVEPVSDPWGTAGKRNLR